MLDPDHRQLYVELLRPPTGYNLAEAIATTYSLDLTTLLGIPIALVLPHLDARKLGDQSAIALLEAIRRASARLTVFCERGLIAAPRAQHVLYGMLERVIVEVQAPRGGCLHAKTWLMRFEPEPDTGGDPVMRLIVLSRNLTADRCWDVSLALEGRITGRNRAANRPLCDLFEALPGRALRATSDATTARVTRLVEQVRKTEWELPTGFEEVRFHTLGLTNKTPAWMPEPSDRLLVISPFVRAEALQKLADTTREPVALIARGEELDRIDPRTLSRFQKTFVLNERAETEDGEDTDGDLRRPALRGLHAKTYVAKRGWDTHIYLGSANASDAALLGGTNIELLAELVGKTSKVPAKGIDGILAADGLGAILTEYQSNKPEEVDSLVEHAERALRDAVIELASAQLVVRFDREGAELVPVVVSPKPLALNDVASIRAWLVTMDPASASDLSSLREGNSASLAKCAIASATGLVAFELTSTLADVQTTCSLNLAIEGLPADRDAHIVRMVLSNRDRFLAYLLALLEGLDADVLAGLVDSGVGTPFGGRSTDALHGLLERLVRVRARDPKRLQELGDVVTALLSTTEGQAVLPEDFAEVWQAISLEVAP